VKIATVLNNDYDSGVYGPVYDRWLYRLSPRRYIKAVGCAR
jgi:hypothetical protein